MLASGSQIGKYVLGKKLGQGGFGVVFRAHDASLDREVALKFLTEEASAQPQVMQRFLQEARSAAKIAHPGIVTVFECGQLPEANNAAYIAMELLDGESLTDRLARAGRLPFDSAMEIARQVASALEAAHRAGIVHRDLKPDNVFLVRDSAVPGGERIKILDFGIAKLGRSASSSVQTQSMQVFGTPRYMSPEQCKSAAAVDHRSDIYTLGCILFELVCGRAPFHGAPGELIAQHVLVEPVRASSLVQDIPPQLDSLIATMLAKEPDDRPQTMAAVQRVLESGGALAPGVAPTLMPGATPPMLFPRPATAGSTAPTTLGGAASSSVVRGATRSKMPFVVGAIGAVVTVAVVVVIVLVMGRGHDDAPAAATTTPPPIVKPRPEPRPEPVAPPPAEVKVEPKPAAEAPRPAVKQAPRAVVKTVKRPEPPPAEVKGLLTVTAKPACEVQIDGGASFHTPIRGYKLPVGRHTLTFTNAELGIADTVTVDIDASQPAVVGKDYSDRVVKDKDRTLDPTKSSGDPPPSKDKTINPFKKP